MSSNLDLYAKVEPLLGIEDATLELHHYFLEILKEKKPKTLIDVGCGRGAFIQKCKDLNIHAVGIDLSPKMIEDAKAKGLSVACRDIADTAGSYDVITAIFDVVNFIAPENLSDFFSHVERLLSKDGFFIADINTLYGFEEVADGVLAYDDEDKSLIVSASYEDSKLQTDFTYFEKEDELYKKSSSTIMQYYYAIEALLEKSTLELQVEMPIQLYGEEPDKAILIFKKV